MIVYRALRLFFGIYLRIAHRVVIRGAERIPATGPLVLFANHTSYLDSMLLALCTDRPVRFIIYRNFYDHPLFGPLVRNCGAIPVSQSGSDAEAFKASLAFLKQGEVIGIFPEGKLSLTGLPSPAQSGAALMAAAAGALLVPVSITGAFFVYPKGKWIPRPGTIRVTVHPPVPVDPGRKKDREYLRNVTDRVMMRIGKRVRGYYRVRGKKRRGARQDVRRPPGMGARPALPPTSGGTS